MITAAEYNALVARAAQNQPLRGTRREGTGPGPHHWRVSTVRASEGGWRLYVGPGTVNDQVAAITYRRENDPRGWKMPDGYPATGDTVDRLLTERLAPPHLLLTEPSADGKTGGDFERVPDAERAQHPSAFRTRPMWELELWTGVVFVTAEPISASLFWDRLGFALPTRTDRYRVAARSRMPARPPGTQYGGAHLLAQLYLVRDPATGASQLYVQQRCFWSLWTAAAQINPLGNFDPFIDLPNFGGIGGGLLDSFADATEAAINTVTATALGAVAELYNKASTVEFWTA